MTEAKEYGVIFITESGGIIGSADKTRWDKTTRFQKIVGYLFRSYKNKFIDVKSLKCNIK